MLCEDAALVDYDPVIVNERCANILAQAGFQIHVDQGWILWRGGGGIFFRGRAYFLARLTCPGPVPMSYAGQAASERGCRA
jgi:hypothetical protein